MPKPRRRRFFALEGRFEVDDTGELQGVINEDRLDAKPADASAKPSADAEEPSADLILPPAFRLSQQPRPRSQSQKRFSFLPVWFGLAGLILGAFAGYYLRTWLHRPVVAEIVGDASPTAAALTPADEDDLDAAYAARHAGRYPEAEQFFNALARRHPGWEPLNLELGRTLFYEGRVYDASSTVKAAVDRGELPSEANYLLGIFNQARGAYALAEVNFARAVSFDPTQPDYYFFWGECLRAEGKILEAVGRYRSALLRNQNEAIICLYRTKLWLSEIEADREDLDGVRAEIDAALAQPHPPMDALIAAAARDLKAGHTDMAAVHLFRARRRAEPDVFAYILRDSFFAAARERPELAELFRSAPPAPPPAANGPASSPTPALPLNGLAPAPAVQPVVRP